MPGLCTQVAVLASGGGASCVALDQCASHPLSAPVHESGLCTRPLQLQRVADRWQVGMRRARAKHVQLWSVHARRVAVPARGGALLVWLASVREGRPLSTSQYM